MTTIASQCMACARLNSDGERCEAFPWAIPNDILVNRIDHREPVAGDNGLQFVAREGKQHPFITLPGGKPDITERGTDG